MNITDIRIFPVGDAKLKAFVSIIIDHSFLISGIKVIEGNTGLFLSMPSKKRKDGTFKDIAHPLNQETRTWMEKTIIANPPPASERSPGRSGILLRSGESPSGKAAAFGAAIRRFESSLPSHFAFGKMAHW